MATLAQHGRTTGGPAAVACERAAPQREAGLGERLITTALRAVLAMVTGATPASLIYLLRYRNDPEIPWGLVGPQFVTLVVGWGALIGVAMAGALMGADALLRARGARLAHPPLSLALAGGLASLLPGLIAGAHFGAMPFPYFGSAAIAGSAVSAVMLLSWAVNAADGRTPREIALGAIMPLPLVAALGAALALIALDPLDIRLLRVLSDSAGVGTVGAVAGAALGTLGGAYVGIATSASRWLAGRAPATDC